MKANEIAQGGVYAVGNFKRAFDAGARKAVVTDSRPHYRWENGQVKDDGGRCIGIEFVTDSGPEFSICAAQAVLMPWAEYEVKLAAWHEANRQLQQVKLSETQRKIDTAERVEAALVNLGLKPAVAAHAEVVTLKMADLERLLAALPEGFTLPPSPQDESPVEPVVETQETVEQQAAPVETAPTPEPQPVSQPVVETLTNVVPFPAKVVETMTPARGTSVLPPDLDAADLMADLLANR